MADREDFATAVGALIKGRSPVGHTHDDRYYTEAEIETKLATKSGTSHSHFALFTNDAVWAWRMYAGGQVALQNLSTGAVPLSFDPAGKMIAGSIPYARVTGAPTSLPPAAHDHESQTGAVRFLHGLLANAGTSTVSVAAVGSSTIEGIRVDDSKYRSVTQLITRMADAYPSTGANHGHTIPAVNAVTPTTGVGVHGYNAGIGGTTSANYLTATILDNLAAIQPSVILHGIGSNDWAQNVPPATYKANLEAAISSIDARVTVPHVHLFMRQQGRVGTGFTYTWDAYADVMREVANANPARRHFIDVAPAFEAADTFGTDPYGWGDADGAHLTNAGHTALAAMLAQSLGVSAVPPGAGAPRSAGPVEVAVTEPDTTGSITLWRDGNTVSCDLNDITMPAGNNALHVVQIPTGFRPQGKPVITATASTEPVIQGLSSFHIYWAGYLTWIGNPDRSMTRPTTPLRGTATWRTADPMPSNA